MIFFDGILYETREFDPISEYVFEHTVYLNEKFTHEVCEKISKPINMREFGQEMVKKWIEMSRWN